MERLVIPFLSILELQPLFLRCSSPYSIPRHQTESGEYVVAAERWHTYLLSGVLTQVHGIKKKYMYGNKSLRLELVRPLVLSIYFPDKRIVFHGESSILPTSSNLPHGFGNVKLPQLQERWSIRARGQPDPFAHLRRHLSIPRYSDSCSSALNGPSGTDEHVRLQMDIRRKTLVIPSIC